MATRNNNDATVGLIIDEVEAATRNLCLKCGSIRRYSELTEFTSLDSKEMFQHLNLVFCLHYTKDRCLLKCSREKAYACKKTSPFRYHQFEKIRQKYASNPTEEESSTVSKRIDKTLQGHTKSSPLRNDERPHEVFEPEEPLPSQQSLPCQDSDQATGKCIMDISFLSNFKCKECCSWLRVQDVQKFTTAHFWGTVHTSCNSCGHLNILYTVADTKETQLRYIAAVDSCGVFVRKAEELFLCNDLVPPNYHMFMNYQSTLRDDMEEAALDVAKSSLSRALEEESALYPEGSGITVRGDFGWHTRANNNSLSGRSLL